MKIKPDGQLTHDICSDRNKKGQVAIKTVTQPERSPLRHVVRQELKIHE